MIEAARSLTGAPRWLIYDPVQHRFISIGRNAYVLLQVWREGAPLEMLLREAYERHAETIEPADAERFIAFLAANRLTLEAPGGWRALARVAALGHGSIASRLLHSYLFFRIPLWRPERFLRATLDAVRPLGSVWALAVVALTGLTGLYLVSREWDQFLATFAGIFSLEGGALLALALLAVKFLHELGHAYVATHFGCRVPVIGVAFVLGAPMLYSDVTDGWRLTSRAKRFRIDIAGVLVDLAVGSIATFLWAFLPEGGARSFAFSLATAGWIFSLTMNLNPFMKFDGYHIACDLVGLENMQDRAMALGRWRLRELLFALRSPSPEAFPRSVTNGLIAYAWTLWIYRLVLFTGIAFAVYAFFFKLAGVLLFLVEIGYFILAPAGRELREWWTMRRAILTSQRTLLSGGLVIAACVFAGLPLSSEVGIPAVLSASVIARLYPALPAEVRRVHVGHGDRVAAGAPLVSLASVDVAQDLLLTHLKTEVVAMRLARRTSDSLDREEALVLEKEQAALLQRRDGLLRQKSELNLIAPFAGQVVELLPALHPGRWLNPREAVLVVRGEPETGSPAFGVRGTLDERNVWRVKAGARAVFVPDDLNLPRVEMRVASIAQSASAVLDQIELASSHGGRVADRLDQKRQPVPVTAQFAVRAMPVGPIPEVFAARSVTGLLVAEGAPESLIARAWRQVLRVLVRESGA